ncbi:hypothetical protein PR048_017136 [Dryococelus australis]|uniref:Uncharacterized protein n=1 Tax=Dryococelus australis TaxID=614101 RepID=A0ABQ9H8P1_9NEOP|nr:hypothetical protein PR048_017136 [Dryococelus australis]
MLLGDRPWPCSEKQSEYWLGMLSERRGKPKQEWLQRESRSYPPECDSNGLPPCLLGRCACWRNEAIMPGDWRPCDVAIDVRIRSVSMEQPWNARAGETGDLRENQLTSSIVHVQLLQAKILESSPVHLGGKRTGRLLRGLRKGEDRINGPKGSAKGCRYTADRRMSQLRDQKKRPKNGNEGYGLRTGDEDKRKRINWGNWKLGRDNKTKESWAEVAERLDCSPPTKANRVQYPAGSPDFRKRESCRMVALVSAFSRGFLVSPALSFRHRSILISITLIGLNLFTFKKAFVKLRAALNFKREVMTLRKAATRTDSSLRLHTLFSYMILGLKYPAFR